MNTPKHTGASLALVLTLFASVFSHSKFPSQTAVENFSARQEEGVAVTADVSVFDKRWNFVSDLKSDDFFLTVDGKRQRITSIKQESDIPLNLVFLIDVSGSQESHSLGMRSVALWSLKSVWKQGLDQGKVFTFSETVFLKQPLTDKGRDLQTAIEGISFNSSEIRKQKVNGVGSPSKSAIWDAVASASQDLGSSNAVPGQKVMILITDGFDNSSRNSIDKAIQAAVRNEITIYAIGIEDSVPFFSDRNGDFLFDLAKKTGGWAFLPQKGEDLTTMFSGLNQVLRSRYAITFSPSINTGHSGFHKLKVEIRSPNVRKEIEKLFFRPEIFIDK